MKNLTRWNRAGLKQLHYIEGNAATYLDDLRFSLRDEFASEPEVLQWLGNGIHSNDYQDQLTFFINQYRHSRRDYAWELLRTYARAVHILAQTTNAYANERYLGTATQWDNVRRLVNLLNYHPAPPASAETWVVLLAKEDAIGAVTHIRFKVIEPDINNRTFSLADMRLKWAPDITQKAQLNGLRVVEISEALNATAGDMYVYKSGKSYYPQNIEAVEGKRLKLSSIENVSGKKFYATNLVKSRDIDGSNRHVLPKERQYNTVWLNDKNLTAIGNNQKLKKEHIDKDDKNEVLYEFINANEASGVYFLANDTPVAFKVKNITLNHLSFNGKAGDIASGQSVLLHASNAQWYARKITKIIQNNENFSVEGGSSQTNTIELALEELPEALTFGRVFWLVSSSSQQRVTLVEANQTDVSQGIVQLRFSQSIDSHCFARYDTIIYGNVILAGHGESKETTVLGSGDRTQANQSFTYPNSRVSFILNTQFSAGVSAALRIWVDKREWTQVDNLRNSEATDSHFQVRLNQDQQLVIEFGDGDQGQRVFTGMNNIRLQARLGHGIKGNLIARSLEKLKKPHKFVDSVIQVEDGIGGGDLESTHSLRSQAPTSTLTLSRAVSITDYESLSKRQSSIWQAKAYSPPPTPGSTDQVCVVIVPAGGGASGDLSSHLKTTLENQSRPGVNITIHDYEGLLLELDITLRIDTTAYNPDEVAEAVKLALIERFDLALAQFDQSIYRSHIFHTVESIEGVENADCTINPHAETAGFMNDGLLPTEPAQAYRGEDNFIRRLTPSAHQVIYLNPDIKSPVIRTEAIDG